MDFFLNAINLKIFVNIIIFLLIIIFCICFLQKLDFKLKSYKYLFICYTLFWMPIMLLRPYRATLQDSIDKTLSFIPLMMYGLIGIVFRPLCDFLALKLRSRKTIIYLALIIQLITNSVLLISINQATIIIQSIGIGVGASLIGNYELLFKEQYGKSKTLLTVSILAIPPLLSDFATSPIQSLVASYSSVGNNQYDNNKLILLWLIATFLVLITICFTIFIKEDRMYVGIYFQQKNIASKNDNFWYLYLIMITGFIVAFIKFANSGAVGLSQLKKYGEINYIDTSSFEGYLSMIFSLSQLSGTILFGFLTLNKHKSINQIFMIGIFTWISYHLISIFNINPYSYFVIHIFNGFSYGILYNLLLGIVLNYRFKNKYFTPMGVYQTLLAVAITVSNFFTSFLKTSLTDSIKTANFIINLVIIILLIIIYITFYLCQKYTKKIEDKMLCFKKNHKYI